MFWRKRSKNPELLQQMAEDGSAIREMLQHRAGRIVEKRLEDELEFVRREWQSLLERDDVDIKHKQDELYAYLRALQLVQFIFLQVPKIGWNAEDKLLAFAERDRVYTQ